MRVRVEFDVEDMTPHTGKATRMLSRVLVHHLVTWWLSGNTGAMQESINGETDELEGTFEIRGSTFNVEVL